MVPSPIPMGDEAPESGSRDRALDGLRGLAILLVFLYHSTWRPGAVTPLERAGTWLSQVGFAGVDLFFVLSGFLITRILLRERESPRYFSAFYGRRVLRIFPLYYALVALWLLVLPALGAERWIGDLWRVDADREGIWYWLYLSNWHDGFEGRFGHRMLAVAWSLAIEEQFYLVWPLAVRLLSRRALAAACVAAIGGALALRTLLVAAGAIPLTVYLLTPCRVDTLAFGALVALAAGDDDRWSRVVAANRAVLPAAAALTAAICALLIAYPLLGGVAKPYTLLAHPLMQTAGYSAFALLSACLVVRLVAPAPAPGALDRFFRARWLVGLGTISYGVYLLHTPVIYFVTLWVFDPESHAWGFYPEQTLRWVLTAGATLAAAAASWRWLEAPLLRRRKRFAYR
jgi:peptidoglycan/LPS O-acetylase OafA/YrhL